MSTSPAAGRVTVLVAPDKFKGSLTAGEVARAIGEGLAARAPEGVDWRALPLADGGDGSVEAALAAGFEAVAVRVSGPTGEPVEGRIALRRGTAVLEVAGTCGLQALPGGRLEPLTSTSLGLGLAVRAGLAEGAARIVVGLGGSASTDGGAGMLAALGARFLDRRGEAFVPAGGTLCEVARVDLSRIVDLAGVELVAASDVQNPLLGPDGAAAVYGPQKGASPSELELLEAGLAHLVARLDEAGMPASSAAQRPGAGSAGGLGFAALLLGARVVSGADFFLDLLGFDEALGGADLVVTGEGRLDGQTLSGKLPLAVARRAGACSDGPVPVVAVVGHNALGRESVPEHGIGRVYALSSMTERDTVSDPRLSAQLLAEAGRDIARRLGVSF
ncbi:glycerate kinase [Sinomonas sp. ASV486]|uniref:glycerate kinase n=1 Tax=Sinomonas sp. ASV486 TaxID=3051170 RepID=UPI0027DD1FF5|nr:glycerate kinase [Sinomonas sp. ASV486]MDQ4491962.1 glycerate kinase [Sinomonas sp. ASV486]